MEVLFRPMKEKFLSTEGEHRHMEYLHRGTEESPRSMEAPHRGMEGGPRRRSRIFMQKTRQFV